MSDTITLDFLGRQLDEAAGQRWPRRIKDAVTIVTAITKHGLRRQSHP